MPDLALIFTDGPEGLTVTRLGGDAGGDALTAALAAESLVAGLKAAGHLPDLTPSRVQLAIDAALAALAAPRLAVL